MSTDIKNMIKDCLECQQLRPTPVKEPLVQDSVPSRPFEMATSDFAQLGRYHYLIYADRLSGFPLVAEYPGAPSSTTLIKTLRQIFAMTGVPSTLRSDQGPQYASEATQKWLKSWNVKWIPSSPHNPRSNGHAESMVKAVKTLLKKTGGRIDSDEFQAGMLELRNSPKEDGLSPAERVYGHPIRSRLPTHWTSFRPEWRTSADVADAKRVKNTQRQKFYYDKSSAPRQPLAIGDEVLVQDPQNHKWDRTATVIERDFRRYRLLFPSGRYKWRNIRFLRKLHITTRPDTEDDYDVASQEADDNADDGASGGAVRDDEKSQEIKNNCSGTKDSSDSDTNSHSRPKRTCHRPKRFDAHA